jgi:hypothetical protein
MADRPRPLVKKPEEILDDVIAGHSAALREGTESGKRYLLNFLDKNSSIPNAIKFFIYDLLAEDAYQMDDTELCLQAVERAGHYLKDAQAESARRLAAYLDQLRFIERGISLMVDAGEYAAAISLCDLAIALSLGKAYSAKKASIEKMM